MFDTELLARGDFIRAVHTSWKEPCNGLISKVQPDIITVLYISENGITNYFTVKADEIRSGGWTLHWSRDGSSMEPLEAIGG